MNRFISWLFRRQKQVVVETSEVPKVYSFLYVDWLGVYLTRVKIPVITVCCAFGLLIGNGFLLRDPRTGSPSADIFVVNVLGFFAILATGIMFFREREAAKTTETADWHWGRFTLRRHGLPFKPYFHAAHFPIVKLVKDEWQHVHAALFRLPAGSSDAADNNQRQDRVKDAVTAVLAQAGKPEELGKENAAGPAERAVVEKATDDGSLNWFYIPFRTDLANNRSLFPLRGIVHGSRATNPSQLYKHEGGDVVFKGYPRRNGNIEDYDLAVVGEIPIPVPGQEEPDIIPITLAAGDHYSFSNPWDSIMKPLTVNKQTIIEATLAFAGTIMSEGLNRLSVQQNVIHGFETNQLTAIDWAGRLSASATAAISILNTPDKPALDENAPSWWTGRKVAAVLGGIALVTFLVLLGARVI